MKTATAPLPPLRSVKVLDQLRERIRYLHYSLRTEQAYVHWVRAFIRFHGVRHPATLGSSEVEAFLSWLANERKVSVSTHRQALAALLFFYGKVLCTDLPWLQEIGRPRPSRRLPVVLTPDEVVRILGFLEGEHRLFAQLLYGTGMRISEGLQLRVKDLDFDHGTIIGMFLFHPEGWSFGGQTVSEIRAGPARQIEETVLLRTPIGAGLSSSAMRR